MMISTLLSALVLALSGTVPADDSSGFENATVVSGLSVVVEREAGRLVAERDTMYTIAVDNRGDTPRTLRVRVSIPPWMPKVNPRDGGERGSGYVEWPVTLAPGQATTLRVVGEYASPGRDTPTRIAFTACALETADRQPIVCDTDIAKLAAAEPGLRWWWLAAAGLVVAAGAAAVLHLRRKRAQMFGYGVAMLNHDSP